MRNLVESGAIVQDAGRWVSPQPVDSLPLPLGVREVVHRRLSRPDGLTNHALAVGATIGEQFEGRVLLAAGAFDADTLEPALRSAVAARLIEEVPGPAIAFRFAHALVRTTVYEALSAMRRAVMHRRVAVAIEAVTPRAQVRPADLAFHYGAAAVDGDVAKAVEWATAAGRDAAERLAFSEALTHFGNARALREQAGLGADPEACDLLIEVGHAQWALGDPEGRTNLLAAARLAGDLGDRPRAARALLADHRNMPAAIGATDEDRVQAIERALHAMGDDENIERALLTSELALALNCAPGSYRRRRALVEEGVAMARRLQSPSTLAACLSDYWLSIWAPGTAPLRHRAYEELDRLGADIDDPLWHALAQPRRIVHAIECYDIDRAWRASDAFGSMADDLGLPLVKWMAGFHRAGLLEVSGDLDAALAAADEAVSHGLAAGQPDAPAFLDVLRPNASTVVGNGVNWNESVALRVAQLEGLLGNWGRAERFFDQADDIARRMRAPLWQAIGATERAWMHARRDGPGDRDRALELLETARDLAEPRGAHLLRHRGSLVLADLDGS